MNATPPPIDSQDIAARLIELEKSKSSPRLLRLIKRFHQRELGTVHALEDADRKPSIFGQRMADRVAQLGGSWGFIGLFAVGLAAWTL